LSVSATPFSSPKLGSTTSTPSISVAMLREQVGTLARVGVRLDAAEFGLLGREHDAANPACSNSA
jgi:hypothetical protein